ncbi:MAG: hypothetical protein KF773_12405 [Deltaproteobacteria bacterium]|nr:hypothetical protein [Deltaproteobacteria bacterium]
MNQSVVLLLLLAAAACSETYRPLRPTPDQLEPLEGIDPRASSPIGPLALEPGAATTPLGDAALARGIARERYLDSARIRDVTDTFLGLVDTFASPGTPEMQAAFEEAHRYLGRASPSSIFHVTESFTSYAYRLGFCIHDAGVTAPCHYKWQPRTLTSPVFEVRTSNTDIAVLAIHDLGNAADPAWTEFPTIAKKLSAARGLVLDLRHAAGADPRPLLPWLRELTGRPDLAPLRAIERPMAADIYTRFYNERYTDRGRDPAVWRALVGPPAAPPSPPPARRPIEVLVGRHCESACELVARVLEAYAGAVVVGGTPQHGRLGRDEPAMATLPHTHATVYFYATRYLLAADIEAATGPTDAWHLSDSVEEPQPPSRSLDYMTWAIRDVAQRIAHPAGWPRCNAKPVAVQSGPKLIGLSSLGRKACRSRARIEVFSDVPTSALERYLSTCAPKPQLHSGYAGTFRLSETTPPSVLAQIAASELVHMVLIDCVDVGTVD